MTATTDHPNGRGGAANGTRPADTIRAERRESARVGANLSGGDCPALEAEFVARLRERWRRGAEAYGDASFDRPLAATVDELLAEAEDVGGWSFVLWVQLRQRLQRIADGAAALEALHARAVAAELERDQLRELVAGAAGLLEQAAVATAVHASAPAHDRLGRVMRAAAATLRAVPAAGAAPPILNNAAPLPAAARPADQNMPTTTAGGARALLASLLPATWPSRDAVLEAADAIDREHRDGLGELLRTWSAFRSEGRLPRNGALRDVVAALAQVLGGAGPELRLAPRAGDDVEHRRGRVAEAVHP